MSSEIFIISYIDITIEKYSGYEIISQLNLFPNYNSPLQFISQGTS